MVQLDADRFHAVTQLSTIPLSGYGDYLDSANASVPIMHQQRPLYYGSSQSSGKMNIALGVIFVGAGGVLFGVSLSNYPKDTSGVTGSTQSLVYGLGAALGLGLVIIGVLFFVSGASNGNNIKTLAEKSKLGNPVSPVTLEIGSKERFGQPDNFLGVKFWF